MINWFEFAKFVDSEAGNGAAVVIDNGKIAKIEIGDAGGDTARVVDVYARLVGEKPEFNDLDGAKPGATNER